MDSIKVFLVDDEEELVSSMAQRLENRGFVVATAHDGESAVKYLKENDVDIMVLDQVMPGMDGIQTLREVKKFKPGLKVIMLTGYGTIDTAIEGIKAGAVEYLIKPCDTVQLTEMIKSMFEHGN